MSHEQWITKSAAAATAMLFIGLSSALAQYGGPFKLTASDGAASDQFGTAVSISGDTAVVGASGDEAYRGSAYVYRWDGSGWVQLAKLTASDGESGDNFGASLAIGRDTIVVGAAGDESYQGSAYVFVRPSGGWANMTQTAKLTASDGVADDSFGCSLAISGSTIVVGAYSDEIGANGDQGSAYVFVKPASGWANMTQTAKLTASDGAALDRFGYSVAVSGDTVVVGAYFDDSGEGSAYVFVRPAGGWTTGTQTAKLTASDGAAYDYLGWSVAMEGDTIVAGAVFGDAGGTADQGSAYVFVKPSGGWATGAETAKLTASDGAWSNEFGCSVAIDGDTIVVGAFLGDVGATADPGSAYVFVKPGGGWATSTQTAKLSASDGAQSDWFGSSVAIWGETIVVGATFGDVGATADQGWAHVFHRTGSMWVQSERSMVASDGAVDDRLGWSVAIAGDTAVVGAVQDDVGANSNQGSAYVYRWDGSGWVQLAKLTASDGSASEYFGMSVAISGDTIVVTTSSDDIGANAAQGSAYVFVKPPSGWVDMTETAKLTASDGAALDYLGWSVAISGDTIVVGAPYDDIGASLDYGSAYVFVRPSGGWGGSQTETAKLIASDGATNDSFGGSVGISDDTIVVGASDDDVGANPGQGSAYVFVKPAGGWADMTETAKLTASDGAAYDRFGCSVAISGDAIVAGAAQGDDWGEASGSAHVFVKPPSGWTTTTQTAKLTASDGAAGDEFGVSVAIFDDTIVVGAHLDDIGSTADQGSAYVFVRPGGGWTSMAQTAKVTPGDGERAEHAGWSVAIAGDTIIIGLYWDLIGGSSGPGSARSFYVGDECLSLVDNVTSGDSYPTIAEAISSAATGDEILASSGAFTTEGNIDYRGKALALDASRGLMMPYDSVITLANNSSLTAAEGYPMTLFGQIRVLSNAAADVFADELRIGSGGLLNTRGGSALYFTVPESSIDGTLRAEAGSTMSFTGSVTCNGPTTLLSATVFAGPMSVGGTLNWSNSVFSAPTLTVEASGRFIGYGDIYADVTNDNRMYMVGTTLISGDLLNNSSGVITIQIGTTTLIGTLTNYGTIVGEIQNPLMGATGSLSARALADEPPVAPDSDEGSRLEGLGDSSTASGDGFFVQGDYVAGADSSLSLPNAVWRISVAGNYDVAVNNNTKYDMSQAELRLTGGAGVQGLELMSKDIGASPQGLNRTLPGHYPIGTLRLTSPASVQLADNHDNDGLGQSACEALYVNVLIIDSGAALTTGSCRIYYGSLVNNGSVDDPSHLVPICTPSIPADFDGDCDVDGDDLTAFEACATGPSISQADPNCTWARFDADTDVDQSDFAVFQRCYSGENVPADPNCST